ncbi:hypothetical protein [Burkholderia plantarii]|uniref:hypothetical protein n=1 Tax=Burkholderia plantarii TaxID=41899 RepID=UPI0018DB6A47|nr:hypothetical protein [Burkholderia plantarii]MBI0329072.1 hypothetical protein [Burkholderia plantarii]
MNKEDGEMAGEQPAPGGTSTAGTLAGNRGRSVPARQRLAAAVVLVCRNAVVHVRRRARNGERLMPGIKKVM